MTAVMPQKIICEGCNAILYEGYEVVEPIEIISRYNSKCPKCRKKLEFNYEKIEVYIYKQKLANLA